MPEKIRCGVIGYGGAFNMGRAHAEYITQTEGLELTAACDLDPTRTQAAKEISHISALIMMSRRCWLRPMLIWP
jgi:predicted dehydrogenase